MTSLAQTLYEFSQLMQKIEESDGEIQNEILPALSHAEMAVAQKVDNYVNFVDTVKAQIERTRKTIEKFKKNLQTLENLEKRLTDNVKQIMQAHDFIMIDGNERSIKLLTSGGVQAVQKPVDMFYPQECVDVKYIIELEEHVEEKIVYVIKDKEKFKRAIKNNELPNCFMLPRSKYVKFI